MSSRDRILEASFALFIAKGYTAVSISDICRASALTKGGFYHYFGGKEALFHDLLMNEYLPRLRNMLNQYEKTEGDSEADLRAIFRANGEAIALIRSTPEIPQSTFGVYYLLLEGMNYDVEFRSAVRSYYAEFARIVEAILRRGMETGKFRNDLDAAGSAVAAVAEIEGAGILLMVEGERDPVALSSKLADGFLEKIALRQRAP